MSAGASLPFLRCADRRYTSARPDSRKAARCVVWAHQAAAAGAARPPAGARNAQNLEASALARSRR